MNDDRLNDTQQKKKDYCVRCDTEFMPPQKCECKLTVSTSEIKKWNNDFNMLVKDAKEIEIWNAAIEAAALKIPSYEDDNMDDIKAAIRELKK